jgi:lipopolysaccharide biosynthesis protein
MRFFKDLWLPPIHTLLKIRDLPLSLYGQLWRIPNLVRKRWIGADPLPDSKLAAVFVHYDRDGAIHDYVIHQLRELLATGFRIVFVSNAPKLPPESIDQIAPFCHTILWRFNLGYDFGAYKDGLKSIENKEDLNAVLLMNDSVYGPFSRLRDLLADIDRSSTDYWGITDSWQISFHVQSYFILFFPNALRSSAFKKFWRRMPYVNNKGWVIRNGEVKLSRVLAREKLRAKVLAPYWSIAKEMSDRLVNLDITRIEPERHRVFLEHLREHLVAGHPLNPGHYFWDVLILDYKCPFIKRELMSPNPSNVPYSWRWPEVIQRASNYDTSMIWRHLQSRI